MVNAGQPQSVVTLHPLETDQGVLQRSVHGVTHVQLTGDIGGRHNNGEGLLAFVLLRVEVATVLPHFIDLFLNLLRLIDLGQFSCHNHYSFSEIIYKNKRPESIHSQGEIRSAVPPEFPATAGHSSCCDGQTRTSLLLFQEIRSRATIRNLPYALTPTGRSL